jgi:hypothetical protein
MPVEHEDFKYIFPSMMNDVSTILERRTHDTCLIDLEIERTYAMLLRYLDALFINAKDSALTQTCATDSRI